MFPPVEDVKPSIVYSIALSICFFNSFAPLCANFFEVIKSLFHFCGRGMQAGMLSGARTGYAVGHADGYADGRTDGKTDGYADGVYLKQASIKNVKFPVIAHENLKFFN